MVSFAEIENPFVVHTPEGMTAEDTVNLFIDVFGDFPKVQHKGHLFIHGQRGSGKSMMFRFLQPDCQCLVRNCGLSQLPYFSVYVPVKNTDIKLTELQRLENKHASTLINEHFMTMHVVERVFGTFSDVKIDKDDVETLAAAKRFLEVFYELSSSCGWDDVGRRENPNSVRECVNLMHRTCDQYRKKIITYLKKLAYRSDVVPYSGPLCGYLDFLFPLLNELKRLPFMPKGPIFLLIDDADVLSLTQTRILNAWIWSRTSSDVSIKASTQLKYKTYRTAAGKLVQSPHDFSEVNISAVYTASLKAKYKDRIEAIINKRLDIAKIGVAAREFFPVDAKQEEEIRAIAEDYKAKWKTAGRGYRPSDDAYRYARPDYIKSLGGASKSTPTYRYAGFDHLLHISSGVIRNYLDAASRMFDKAQANLADKPAVAIPLAIQDEVVKEIADEKMFAEFEKMRDDESPDSPPTSDVNRLSNLIQSIGQWFHAILLSDRSERRVFSIAVSGELDEEVRRIMKLGSEYGYFHLSSIGNKEGTGRTRLYILNRQLAPYFNLDPSGFAGYLFVTSENLKKAMCQPKFMLRKLESGDIDDLAEVRQLKLFESAEGS